MDLNFNSCVLLWVTPMTELLTNILPKSAAIPYVVLENQILNCRHIIHVKKGCKTSTLDHTITFRNKATPNFIALRFCKYWITALNRKSVKNLKMFSLQHLFM